MSHDRGWHEFINRVAEREANKRRGSSPVGDALWMIVSVAVLLTLIGMVFQSAGWL